MIFGKDSRTSEKDQQNKIRDQILGIQKFAWLPVRLRNYQYVWLEKYWEFREGGIDKDGTLFIWSGGGNEDFAPIRHRYLTYDEAYIDLTKINKDGSRDRVYNPEELLR